MFERYSDEARACVACALAEAKALGHDRVAPAHLLLGIARTCPDLVPRPADEVPGHPAR